MHLYNLTLKELLSLKWTHGGFIGEDLEVPQTPYLVMIITYKEYRTKAYIDMMKTLESFGFKDHVKTLRGRLENTLHKDRKDYCYLNFNFRSDTGKINTILYFGQLDTISVPHVLCIDIETFNQYNNVCVS